MPKFSIIIPVYNVAPYLRECLDSVLAQTFADWEAICVDDGSTDGSGAILGECAAKDERFRIIHQKNAGVSAARNAALKVAIGDYLVFLDADDALAGECLKQLYEAIVRDGRPCVLRYGGMINVSNTGRESVLRLSAADPSGSPLERFASDILANSSLCLFAWRRDVVTAVEFPVGVRYGEDDVYFVRAMPGVESYVQTNIIQYRYRHERVGAASRTLTCLDMSLVLKHVKDELVRDKGRDGFFVRVRRGFYLRFFRKEIMRIRGRDARMGTLELRRCLMECRDALGPFDVDWSGAERFWLNFYMTTGSWLASDAVRIWMFVCRFPGRVVGFCRRRGVKWIRRFK